MQQTDPRDWDVEVLIEAPRACFTVPAFSGERRTYPLPTPSALKGVLESVFWRPEFSYEIARIGVLKAGREAFITRSEMQTRQSERSGGGVPARTLRTTAYLQDVAYLVQARIVRHAHCRATDTQKKYLAQLLRRLERGAHFQTPYLGLREFSATVSLSDGSKTPPPDFHADVGNVFFGHAYMPHGKEMQFRRKDAKGSRIVQGRAVPLFFDMRVRNGWIEIPRDLYGAIRAMEDRHAA